MFKSIRQLFAHKFVQSTILRVILYALVFAYALPLILGAFGASSSYTFNGTAGSSAIYGVAWVPLMFVVFFVIAALYSLLKLDAAARMRLGWFSGSVFFVASAFAPFLATNTGLPLTIHGWLAGLANGLASVVLLYSTMPKGGRDNHEDGGDDQKHKTSCEGGCCGH